MARITISDPFLVTALFAEALPELDLRRQFYWTRASVGKMRQDAAVRRIASMEAIVRCLTVTASALPGTRLRSTKQIGRRVWNSLQLSKQLKRAPRDRMQEGSMLLGPVSALCRNRPLLLRRDLLGVLRVPG
jgi:hypothetical protein